MNKQNIFDHLIRHLEETLEMLINTAKVAREAATGDESKAENKYDTRGLEASYLAGAQAKRSEELTLQIVKLKKMVLREFNEQTPVALTAIVTVELNGNDTKRFLILPFAGGTKITVDNLEYSVISPDSNVGKQIVGKKVGDTFEIKIKDKSLEYEILSVC